MKIPDILAALASFASDTRLYELSWEGNRDGLSPDALVVEAFAAQESLLEIGYRDVIVASSSSTVNMRAMLNRLVRCRKSGSIDRICMEQES